MLPHSQTLGIVKVKEGFLPFLKGDATLKHPFPRASTSAWFFSEIRVRMATCQPNWKEVACSIIQRRVR
jgi:hypothetical protein